MMAAPDPRHIHITSRLGASVPSHVNVPYILSNAVYPGLGTQECGSSFLQPESMEAVARRQELVQKQNLARMEMEMGTIFQQRETGKTQYKGLMGLGLETSFLYQHGIPTTPDAFGGSCRFPEVYFPNDLYVHRSSLDDLHGTGDLSLNGEDLSSVEDIRKWAVDDVYDFVTGLPGCSDYAQIFRDHAIDGETLPLLTEEHLLDTMGLKLGPALKIRSQPLKNDSPSLVHMGYQLKTLEYNCS
ncbi:sterile alpha motif domain-containing protein 7 [Macrotis lagotis]|uniref:sterile alpha motif domain-containing protein 7 n=1 Tax=Macrotis lagotis TaxID=92651 RepID=UPI003D680A5B